MTAIWDMLQATTEVYRKGGVITERDVGFVHVTEVNSYPHRDEAEGRTMVDLHFVEVGVDMAEAERNRAALLEWLAAYPEPERLAGGPSYIEIGGYLGDQEAAFRLFALGEALGLWKVITPEKLHITGPEADELAGGGMVMMSGWKPKETEST